MKILTAQQVIAFLPIQDSEVVRASDSQYMIPTLAWVNQFLDWWKNTYLPKSGLKWAKGFDCDNLAARMIDRMYESHRLSYSKECKKAGILVGDPIGLAVMSFWYERDKGGSHAIVAVIADNTLIYIEPANGQIVALSKDERESCFAVLL